MKRSKKRRGKGVRERAADYYDRRDVLKEITEEDPGLSLSEELSASIRSGRRRYKLSSVTLKLDPMQVMAIKKLAVMKAIPYQTLIRYWLAEDLKREMDLIAK